MQEKALIMDDKAMDRAITRIVGIKEKRADFDCSRRT